MTDIVIPGGGMHSHRQLWRSFGQCPPDRFGHVINIEPRDMYLVWVAAAG